jgi:hypothetical protein
MNPSTTKITREKFIQETILWAREAFHLNHLTSDQLHSIIDNRIPEGDRFSIADRNQISDRFGLEFSRTYRRRKDKAYADPDDKI